MTVDTDLMRAKNGLVAKHIEPLVAGMLAGFGGTVSEILLNPTELGLKIRGRVFNKPFELPITYREMVSTRCQPAEIAKIVKARVEQLQALIEATDKETAIEKPADRGSDRRTRKPARGRRVGRNLGRDQGKGKRGA